MMSPKITISIVNWNGKENLYNCLDSLFSTTNYDSFEVVVVDNGSSDGSVEMVKTEFPEVKLIINEDNLGFSKANNQVLHHAKESESDYVLLLNNDTILVEEDWLSSIVQVGEKVPEIGIIGCEVVEPDGSVHYDGRNFPIKKTIFPYVSKKYDYNRWQKGNVPDSFEYVDEVVGALFLIDINVFKKIGGLDEKFSPAYFEESDYCARAWDAGFRVAYTPDTKIIHKRHGTSSTFDNSWLIYIKTRNRARHIFMNYPLSWVLISLPFLLIHSTRTIIFIGWRDGQFTIEFTDTFRNDFITSLSHFWRIYFEIIIELPDIIRKRAGRRNVRDTTK